ncbi:unnamed protein product [marine sediment metagenome]|uniref:Uncharacterized protein n=1 Tax=marine sediment metagenome TaxID=412755 RepID=X1RKJ0_9ZZZZ
MSTEEQIKSIKKQIPEMEKIVSEKKFDKTPMGKLEYFISQVISIAEITKGLKNSMQLERIKELQKSNRYPTNMYILFPIVKGILETLDNIWVH